MLINLEFTQVDGPQECDGHHTVLFEYEVQPSLTMRQYIHALQFDARHDVFFDIFDFEAFIVPAIRRLRLSVDQEQQPTSAKVYFVATLSFGE